MQVTIRDAAISYGDLTVFSDFSATFESGQVTALVGPSGSGKSSLLAAIAGYLPLLRGQIEVYRSSSSSSSSSSSPSKPSQDLIAWVPQGSNALGRRTVRDNVLVGALASGLPMGLAMDVAEDALMQVGMSHRLEEQARRLSGGELQRVAIARALASGKQLILADEPSANLDAKNTAEVADILHRLVSVATIIVATHDPILVAASHAAIHLRDGLAVDE